MSGFRFMRMLVFFDLPTLTPENRREYRRFRRLLVKNGFMMMQESVYCKLLTTPSVEASVNRLLRANRPPDGLVQTLIVTEKQFAKMEFLIGSGKSELVDSAERVVVL